MQHLHHTHTHDEQHFKGSEVLTDLVIGMSDGLTVPFALAAGLSNAVDSTHIVLTAGIAEIIAGSIAMGLGGYLAGRTEIEHYDAELKREYAETELYPDIEKKEVRDVFAEYGVREEHLDTIVEDIAQDRDKWVQFMMRFELGIEKPDPRRARNSALNIGGAYIVGGLIPLSGYWFFSDMTMAFRSSAAVTLLALLIFGYFKSKVIGQNPWKGAWQTAAIGVAAASAAFFIAGWFNLK
jgi:vacuolar iron transporter family protein